MPDIKPQPNTADDLTPTAFSMRDRLGNNARMLNEPKIVILRDLLSHDLCPRSRRLIVSLARNIE